MDLFSVGPMFYLSETVGRAKVPKMSSVVLVPEHLDICQDVSPCMLHGVSHLGFDFFEGVHLVISFRWEAGKADT